MSDFVAQAGEMFFFFNDKLVSKLREPFALPPLLLPLCI